MVGTIAILNTAKSRELAADGNHAPRRPKATLVAIEISALASIAIFVAPWFAWLSGNTGSQKAFANGFEFAGAEWADCKSNPFFERACGGNEPDSTGSLFFSGYCATLFAILGAAGATTSMVAKRHSADRAAHRLTTATVAVGVIACAAAISTTIGLRNPYLTIKPELGVHLWVALAVFATYSAVAARALPQRRPALNFVGTSLVVLLTIAALVGIARGAASAATYL